MQLPEKNPALLRNSRGKKGRMVSILLLGGGGRTFPPPKKMLSCPSHPQSCARGAKRNSRTLTPRALCDWESRAEERTRAHWASKYGNGRFEEGRLRRGGTRKFRGVTAAASAAKRESGAGGRSRCVEGKRRGGSPVWGGRGCACMGGST